mmetsp:Transcript_113751/g.226385  ORF Transcript_113751/g.226385 Transcript_113751/m.226385 type:complete len:204 (-) Transcript_113751:1181-1792(-)
MHSFHLFIPFSKFSSLLLRLLILCHEGTNLFCLLFQLFHLLLGIMHAPALLCHANRVKQGCIHGLLLSPAEGPLNLHGTHIQLPFLCSTAPDDPTSPCLYSDHLLQSLQVLGPRIETFSQCLDFCCSFFCFTPLQIKTSLLRTNKRLHVAREESNGLVHVPANLSAPTSLDEGCTLDQKLEACKLNALKCSQFEKDKSLPNCP